PRLLVSRRACGHRGIPVAGGGIRGRRNLPAAGPPQRRGLSRRVRRADRCEVAAHRPLEAPGAPYLEPRIRPLLDRQDLDPVEPWRLPVRRLAPLWALSEGARRKGGTGCRDPLPARTGVHGSADDRRRDGYPQGVELLLLPGPGRPDRDRTGDSRPGRICGRDGRARHRHVHGRWGAARPLPLFAQRPVGARRRAVARVSGTAHGYGLREARAGPVRETASSHLCRRNFDGPPLPVRTAVGVGLRAPVSRGVVAGGGARPWGAIQRRGVYGEWALDRSAHLLGRPVLRRGARRPPGRRHASSAVERVRRAGHRLSALWLPLLDAPRDRGPGPGQVLPASLR